MICSMSAMSTSVSRVWSRLERRPEHKELALLLGAVGYRGFVSVEMAHTDVDTIRRTMDYIAEVFA